jgi:ABC-type transport system involved in multi-copper enzyme maturation permease subunit
MIDLAPPRDLVVPADPPHAPVRLRQVARSEWTKLRTLRSTWWSLAAYVVLALGFCALATYLYAGRWDSLSAADRLDLRSDPIGLILQPGAVFGQIAVCVLGVLMFAGEYSTGSIRASVLAVPRRRRLLLAKVVVLAALLFALAEAVAFGSYALAAPFVGDHAALSLADPTVRRALFGAGAYLAVTGLLGLAVGALVRHIGGAVTLILAMILVLPALAGALPGRSGEYAATYLPGGQAGQTIMSTGAAPDLLVGPWQGLAVACGWTLLALLFADRSLARRDV